MATFLAELAVAWALTFAVFGIVTLATMEPGHLRNQRYYWASILGLRCSHGCSCGRCRLVAWHPGPHRHRAVELDRVTRAESIASDFRRAA